MDGLSSEYFSGVGIFGDIRLDRRLEITFEQMAKRPTETLPKKLPSKTVLTGGYRMFNNPDVTHAKILEAHQRCCLEWLSQLCEQSNGKELTLLLLHDTTVLDYSGLNIEGLGQIGNGHGKGLYAHNSLAVLREGRQVVGLMNQILHRRDYAPPRETRAARAKRRSRESRLWRMAVEAQPPMPAGIRVIDVSDRGSDITEYIEYEIRHGRTFIVRSQHNRRLVSAADGTPLVRKLHERIRARSAMHRYPVCLAGADGGRTVWMELAWEQLRLNPPRQKRGDHGREPLTVWAVLAREENPQDPKDPIEWILLTNQPIETAADAQQVVSDYGCRWLDEDYHKAQKTGCGIEMTQMTQLHGLENVIALTSVLAVHVLKLRCLARDEKTKDEPARAHEDELKVRLAARHTKHADWRTMTVWEFYIAVAKLGGYMLNPEKRPPGWIILWRGYTRLNDMAEGVSLLRERCVET
jgi:hypothetical protein